MWGEHALSYHHVTRKSTCFRAILKQDLLGKSLQFGIDNKRTRTYDLQGGSSQARGKMLQYSFFSMRSTATCPQFVGYQASAFISWFPSVSFVTVNCHGQLPLLKENSDKNQTCKGFQTHPLDWNGSTCIPSEQNMTFSIQLITAVVRPFSQYITCDTCTKHVYTNRSAMLNLCRWFDKKVSIYTILYNHIPMCKAYICNSSCSGTWYWDPHDALRDVAKILVLVWIDYRRRHLNFDFKTKSQVVV